MNRSKITSRSHERLLLTAAIVLLVPALMMAGDRRSRRARKAKTAPQGEQVEMFSAIKDGLIEVKVHPKDETGANIVFENKSDKPLNVRVPRAVVAVPVLKQGGGFGGGGLGGGGGGLGGGGLGGGGGGGQSLGGGLGGGGLGGGGLGGGGLGGGGLGGGGLGGGGLGGGFLNVPLRPEGKRRDTRTLQMHAVCLEHGKDDPRPKMNYRLVALEDYTKDPVLQGVIRHYAAGKVVRPIAQAAAWHVANEMSWNELANKRVERATGPGERFFDLRVIRAAQTLVNFVEATAEESKDDANEVPSAADARVPSAETEN